MYVCLCIDALLIVVLGCFAKLSMSGSTTYLVIAAKTT